MNIIYTQEKNFDAKTLLKFFTISGNDDAKYDNELVKSINNSATVVTAWDKDTKELAGLVSVIDDGNITAYVRYLVVAPNYRGKGINDELLSQVKAKYEQYPYLFAFAPDDFHASFFTKLGFKIINGATVLSR